MAGYSIHMLLMTWTYVLLTEQIFGKTISLMNLEIKTK